MQVLTVGDVEIIEIEEARGTIGMRADELVPGLPEQAWDEQRDVLVPDHLDPADGQVKIVFRTWLLRSDGCTVLVDTSVGNGKDRPVLEVWDQRDGDEYLQNLARAGVRPEDVDVVVNTHLHVDHVGWNTRSVERRWVPTFPRARYLVPRPDLEFWDPSRRPAAGEGVNANVFEDSVQPVLDAGLMSAWEGSHHVDGALVLEAAPGHTPGSSIVRVSSRGEHALLVGDVLHSPVQVAHPEVNSCFCEDPARAVATRGRLLGWAADHGALVLPAHVAGSGVMEVGRQGSGFSLDRWATTTATQR